jgi:O-methyltransferase
MKKVKEIDGVRTYEINWENRPTKYTYNQELIFPRNTYNPWFDDKEFMDIYSSQVRLNTLVDIYRCYELWDIAKRLKDTKGSILEVGVWKGGTGCLLAAILLMEL